MLQTILLTLRLLLVSGAAKCPPQLKGCDCYRNEMGCSYLVDCPDADLRSIPNMRELTAEVDCLRLRNNPGLGDLEPNQLRTQLAAFSPHLKLLDLHGCRLGKLLDGSLQADTFSQLTELRWLGLEGNNLVTLPNDLFRSLRKLRVLQLTGPFDAADGGLCWPLEQIPLMALPEDRSMCEAHIKAANRLKSLPDTLLQGLTSLQILMLHHNKLTELPSDLLRDSPQLKVIKLLDNAIEFGSTDLVFSGTLSLCPSETGGAYRSWIRGIQSGKPWKCLQLDLVEDTGDELEEMWFQKGSFWGFEDKYEKNIENTFGLHKLGKREKLDL